MLVRESQREYGDRATVRFVAEEAGLTGLDILLANVIGGNYALSKARLLLDTYTELEIVHGTSAMFETVLSEIETKRAIAAIAFGWRLHPNNRKTIEVIDSPEKVYAYLYFVDLRLTETWQSKRLEHLPPESWYTFGS